MAKLIDDPKVAALVEKTEAAATKAEKKRIAAALKEADFGELTGKQAKAVKAAIKAALA